LSLPLVPFVLQFGACSPSKALALALLCDRQMSPQAETALERLFFSDFSRAAILHDPTQ
jgi:hypothetical protein